MSNDSAICQSILDSMRDDFTEICCMTSSVKALSSYVKQDYSLVILDIQLTDMDGMVLLRTIRNTNHTPILALTNPLAPSEIVTLLHAGADTYIEKPLNVDVCAAQANVLIQLYTNSDIDHNWHHNRHKPIVHGTELIISPRYRQVIVDGKPLELTRKEFDLLHCFAKYPGQVLSREELYDHIWNNEPAVAVDEAVKSLIKKLRKKLAAVGKVYIQNTRGVGYKLVLPD